MNRWHDFWQYYMSLVLALSSVLLFYYGDRTIALFFAQRPLSAEVDYFFRCLDILGEPQWYLLPCLGCIVLQQGRNKKIAAAWYYVMLNVLVVSVVAFSMKWVLGRARPGQFFFDGTYGFFPDWSHYNASFMSLPSGHAAVIFAFGIAISLVFPKYGVLALMFAVLVSSSRLVLTWHYLSDILAGIACALYCSFAVYKREYGESDAQRIG